MCRGQFDNQRALFFTFTCVKNGRQFISRLFESLLMQTKKNFIHYIYDDGSTEPLDEMIEEYKQKVSKLTEPYEVIYEKNPNNIGLNMATKHCIDMCSCPYFIWIDCDNWVEKDFFKEMEKGVIDNPDAIVLRSNLKGFTLDGRNHFCITPDKNKKRYNQYKQFFYDFFSYSFFAVNNKYFVDNKTNICILDFKNYFNDTQVILNCLLTNKKFVFLEKAIGCYLSRENSESHLNEINDIDLKYRHFVLTLNALNHPLSKTVPVVLELVKSYKAMVDNLKDSPRKSYEIYKQRRVIIKSYKIDNVFWYKQGNNFSWFLVILKKIILKRKRVTQ